ncbi:hypothetical protein C8J56DRAFT_1020264 [Mycena floridula]|nr:hypothetical protein C8J56DRAFT_1020264 [Mycena floridula]
MSGLPDRVTPIPQDLFAKEYGGSLICCMIMLVLYGAAVIQTYMYFLNYTRDHIALKSLVFIVGSLATIHSIFACNTVYHYVIITYTQPELLISGEWSVYAATSVGVVLCLCIQIFYAKMLYTLSRKTWRLVLTIILAILIVGQLAFGILLSVKLFQLWDLPKTKAAVYIAMVPLYTVRVVLDIVTSIALCIILYDSRPSMDRASKLVNTLIVYAMNRFVLTTLVVIILTIMLISSPGSIWAMVLEFIPTESESPLLYVNSFLTTLNSRNHLREIGGSGQVISASLSTVRFRSPMTRITSLSITQEVDGQKHFDIDFNKKPRIQEESYSMSAISHAV